jgi:peptidoglycan/xylan/chitin deacetylase (PgdA/CDA1 family)
LALGMKRFGTSVEGLDAKTKKLGGDTNWYVECRRGMKSIPMASECPTAVPARRSAILTYHSLDDSGSVISIPPGVFRRQMETLAASSTPVVPLTELANHPGAVALTFDDGFVNFAEHAVPVLESLSLPATVFVVSGHCGGRNNWLTQSAGVPKLVPELPLMDWKTLRALPPRISLGAHTVTHPDLRRLTDVETRKEIYHSRAEIEQQTGRSVESFAYPYGAVSQHAAALVRPKFRVGCGTRLRFVDRSSDPAILPRLDAYYLKSTLWFRNPLSVFDRVYIGSRRCLRESYAWLSLMSRRPEYTHGHGNV